MRLGKPIEEFTCGLLAVVAVIALLSPALFPQAQGAAQAQEADEQKDSDKPRSARPAMYLTVKSPVDDAVLGRIQNAAIGLQNDARQAGREAILVLEVAPGSSPFHQVHGLATFLTSSSLSEVKTVAWVPETVTGNNVVIALACNEIIMHPDAELGDIGRGKSLSDEEQQFILNLVRKRHNVKLSPGLVKGLMDPSVQVLKIEVEKSTGVESEVVTSDELRRRLDAGENITSRPLKDAGVVGRFSGAEARARDILVAHTAQSRNDIAELYGLPPESLRENPTAGADVSARLIKVEGTIDSVLESFLERQIDRAVAQGANMIVFEIDSPGGLLLSSLELSKKIAALEERKVRTIAYVPDMALSGAAIIALGCDEIYLHPDAELGDAGPISIGPGGQFERAPEKIVSVLRLELQQIAEKKGRPGALAMAMADRNLEVFEVRHAKTGRIWYMTEDQIHEKAGEWTKVRRVPESGNELLLTVDGQRAADLKLAQQPVRNFDELKGRIGIPANVNLVPVARNWVDDLIFFLNTKAALFLLVVIGFICLFIELHVMTGLLGIIAALCFSLFFWSRFMGGTAGWLEVVLFVLGAACLLLEIFVVPGFGVFGISGGLLLLASLVLASQTWGQSTTAYDLRQMAYTMGTLSGAIVAVVLVALAINRFLPQIPFMNAMILSPPGSGPGVKPDEPLLRPELMTGMAATSGTGRVAVGSRGTAITVLRPAGKAQIEDEMYDVVSDGPFIERGAAVEVVEASRNRIIVREV